MPGGRHGAPESRLYANSACEPGYRVLVQSILKDQRLADADIMNSAALSLRMRTGLRLRYRSSRDFGP
jgi:hypothetical protein